MLPFVEQQQVYDRFDLKLDWNKGVNIQAYKVNIDVFRCPSTPEYQDYCSDMTRTFFTGEPSEEERKVYELVRQAQAAAEALVKPGVRLCDIDAAARDLITEAGYGPYFNHRLGHFIGLEDHEAGDVSAVNENPALCKWIQDMVFANTYQTSPPAKEDQPDFD